MTVQSWGYGAPKGVMPGLSWARLHSFGGGKRYWVDDENAVKVTPLTGTREVSISAGYFGGYGILDYNPEPATVQLPVVASGTQWFMVCGRRNWATKETDFTFIDAGPTGTTLPARPQFTSGVDAQPLALVPLAAGSSNPGAGIDLRLMGTEQLQHALSELVLQYATWLGAEIRISGATWRRILNSAGTGQDWENDAEQVTSAAGFPKAGSGVTTATVVVDRLVVPARPVKRTARMATNCYSVADKDNTVLELLLTANGAVIGRARDTLTGSGDPVTLFTTGKFTIPANTAVTFEARVSRFSGTGKFTTSISGALTNSNLQLERA